MFKSMARRTWLQWASLGTIIFMFGTGIATYAWLNSFDFNSLKPDIAKVVKEVTGRDLSMGQLELQIGFTPILLIQNLAFRNPKWADRLDRAQIRAMEVHVELLPLFFQKIVVKRLVLIEPDVQLEIGKSGLSNFHFNPPDKEGKEANPSLNLSKRPQFAFREILVKNGRFSWKRADSMDPLSIRLERFEATTNAPDAPIRLTLKGSFRESSFELQAVTGSFEQFLKQDGPWPLEATVEALGAHSSFKGSIADVARIRGVNLSLTAEGVTGKGVGELLHFSPVPWRDTFNLVAEVSCPEPGIYNISGLRLQIKGTEISSDFQIRGGGKKPKISGIAYFQDLDLRPFLGRPESASARQQRKKVFSDTPMNTDILRALDGEFKIRAKRIITPYGLMQDVEMDAQLKDACLTMRPLKATIGGGIAEAQWVCRAEGKSFAVSGTIKVDDVDLNRFLKDLHTDDAVDGTVGWEGEVSTFGNSVGGLMAHLSGKTIATIRGGRIKHHFLRLIGGDLSTSILGLFGSSRSAADYTAIECAVCRLDIGEGIAKVTALVVDTPETTLHGSGEIDFRTERLDLSVETLPKRGLAGLSLSLGELTKPFKLGGTLADPSLAIDPTKTALTVGKAVAGVVLFGPLGVAGALAGKTSDQNPCASALEAAQKGPKRAANVKGEESATYRNLHERDALGGY